MTTTIKVQWTDETADALAIFASVKYGVLTTAHAMSSRGLPVLVGDDGAVYGAGEMGQCLCVIGNTVPADNLNGCTWRALSADESAIVAAARMAGYSVHVAVDVAVDADA